LVEQSEQKPPLGLWDRGLHTLDVLPLVRLVVVLVNQDDGRLPRQKVEQDAAALRQVGARVAAVAAVGFKFGQVEEAVA